MGHALRNQGRRAAVPRFGLVGLDRFMILPMHPTLMKELGLSYQDLGLVTGILSMAWGTASLFMGRLADRVGQRRVVVCAIVAFSVLVGASGLATGLGTLLLTRAMMGFADGAFTPPSIVATLEASKPTRHGLTWASSRRRCRCSAWG